jgi:hypothetical protein
VGGCSPAGGGLLGERLCGGVVPKREKEEVIVVAIVVLVFARSVGRLVGGWRVGCMKSMDGGWTDGRAGWW